MLCAMASGAFADPGLLQDALLVTGGSGLLGVHAVEAALASGGYRKVVLAARRPWEAPLSPDVLASPRASQLERMELDLTGPGAPARACERLRPRAILSLAACSRQAEAEAEPARAQRINGESPGELATWAAAAGARLVHVSTDLVFEGGTVAEPGSGSPQALREADAPVPRGVYARTKLAGERAVASADPRALVVRLPLLFGDSRGRGTGASDALVDGLVAGRRTVLFTDEERQPLELSTAAEHLVALCDRPEPCGLLHLPGPELISRSEFGLRVIAAHLAAGAGSLPAPELAPRSALGLEGVRPARLELASTRARAVLGRDVEPLERGLARWAASLV